jgi:hypothetical protein
VLIAAKKVEKETWIHGHDSTDTVHNHVPYAKHREQGTSNMWGSHDMYTMKRKNLSTSTYIQVQLTKWRRETASKPITLAVTHTKNMSIAYIIKVNIDDCPSLDAEMFVLVTHIVMSLVIGNSKCNLPITLICICTFGYHYSPFFLCCSYLVYWLNEIQFVTNINLQHVFAPGCHSQGVFFRLLLLVERLRILCYLYCAHPYN